MSDTGHPDARENTYSDWVRRVVETPDGVGDVVADNGDEIEVEHEFLTHGTTQDTYQKSAVVVIEDPQEHPSYGDNQFRREIATKTVEEASALDEPKEFLS